MRGDAVFKQSCKIENARSIGKHAVFLSTVEQIRIQQFFVFFFDINLKKHFICSTATMKYKPEKYNFFILTSIRKILPPALTKKKHNKICTPSPSRQTRLWVYTKKKILMMIIIHAAKPHDDALRLAGPPPSLNPKFRDEEAPHVLPAGVHDDCRKTTENTRRATAFYCVTDFTTRVRLYAPWLASDGFTRKGILRRNRKKKRKNRRQWCVKRTS